MTASSTARRFSTGSAPGSPRQTGQTLVFGARAEARRAGAENLGRGGQLHMHFEADNRLVFGDDLRAAQGAR